MKNRILCSLFCFLLLFAMLPVSAFADASIDATKTAKLTVNNLNDGEEIPGTEFNVYKVSTLEDFLDHKLSGDFADFAADLMDLDTEGWSNLASTLEGEIDLKGYEPALTGFTGDDGLLTFENVDLGMYLILGEPTVIGNTTYYCKPTLVFLPGRDPETKEWLYDVTVIPKHSKVTISERDYKITRSVLKVWDDAGYEDQRPESVTVVLLCDGERYDTVTLSDSNSWSYSWKGLSGNHLWTLAEETVEGYQTVVSEKGITFVVTNTVIPSNPPGDDPTDVDPNKYPPGGDPTGDDPTEEEDPLIDLPNDPTPLGDREGEELEELPEDEIPLGDIPQTGLLWWPVPVLAVLGMFLFLAGLVMRRREGNE